MKSIIIILLVASMMIVPFVYGKNIYSSLATVIKTDELPYGVKIIDEGIGNVFTEETNVYGVQWYLAENNIIYAITEEEEPSYFIAAIAAMATAIIVTTAIAYFLIKR